VAQNTGRSLENNTRLLLVQSTRCRGGAGSGRTESGSVVCVCVCSVGV
jgi:hypothetical protein